MFSKQQTAIMNKQVLALILLAGLCAVNAWAQSAPAQDASKPVLPASDSTSVAKATPLPATDTPASRVSGLNSQTALPEGYVIGIGDGLSINVWKEGELSREVGVRPDGMITLPLVGEIKAVGLTPTQLQEQLTASLGKVLSDPVVTVSVMAVNSLSFNIMGNVFHPGYFPLTRPVTILDAIALSGGFRDFAKDKKIYVLRTNSDGTQQKLKFNYREVIKGKKMAQNILLQPRDILVVP
jgi:polysaccharide export outer membrane protein